MTSDKILKVAQNEIGVTEFPSGSNKVKYNTEYYGREVSGADYPWCCAWVWWVFKHADASVLFYGGGKTAYCPTVEAYYKATGQWFKNGMKGDIVLFDFNNKGIAGHIGIVEKVNADGTYTTIEGNTSTSSQDNGGAVMRRVRSASVIRGFARPRYTEEKEMSKEEVLQLIQEAIKPIIKENDRQNEVINAIGVDLTYHSNDIRELQSGHKKQNELLYDIRTKVGV